MLEYALAIAAVIICLQLALIIYCMISIRRRDKKMSLREMRPDDVAVLAEYVKNDKAKKQAVEQAKQENKDLKKHQLETFKQTKDKLRNQLKSQLDEKEWESLEKLLKKSDKGGVGIYVLFNETQNKYYVGQAKQIIYRIKQHFSVEPLALDRLNGDKFSVKFITANELDAEYRLDHIEKTGIEIFDSKNRGYNATEGNL